MEVKYVYGWRVFSELVKYGKLSTYHAHERQAHPLRAHGFTTCYIAVEGS